ncbi:MAG: EAL domain-containing protein [Actinomycetota bacterium]|nr:EAL domain-containing protein [Actinomycetota bacterium]
MTDVVHHLEAVDDVLARGLHAVYQPIVDLATDRVVAWEALARGPEGHPLGRPDQLFEAATAAGRLVDVDRACMAAALRGALDAGVAPDQALFINVEPDTIGYALGAEIDRLLDRARLRFRIVLELTERNLTSRPAELLDLVTSARRSSWGLALDDVGVDTASLAFLPFVSPDVIKLDRSVIQGLTTATTGRVLNAVMAATERRGAMLLAEGIETESHREKALSLGARYGQGFLLGRPGPLATNPSDRTRRAGLPILGAEPLPTHDTPFDAAAGRLPFRVARKDILMGISLDFEDAARRLGDAPVVLSAFQTADRFSPATASRYGAMARTSPLVAAFGVGLGGEPAPGVRGVDLAPDDPLAREWTVVVLGPHFAGALIGRDLGDDVPDPDRRFDYAITHDRDVVLAAAVALMRRVTPNTGRTTSAVA